MEGVCLSLGSSAPQQKAAASCCSPCAERSPAIASCTAWGLSPSLRREQNSTKADQVFAEITKAIGEYPVDFRGARILTGNEEGSFGWITVNYLLETLVKVRAGALGIGEHDMSYTQVSLSPDDRKM